MLMRLRKARDWVRQYVGDSRTPEEIFRHIYATNFWGGTESRSGNGSGLEQTRVVRQRLPALCQELQIQTMLDIPCGDFFWMSQVDLKLPSYLGADIVPEIVARNHERHARSDLRRSIAFTRLDLLTSRLPKVDLILCRDCLVHFANADILRALRNMSASGSTYLLTTTFPSRNNVNVATGDWRAVNLQKAPFSLRKPLLEILEGCTEQRGQFSDKTMALWKLSDLPH